MHTFRLSLFLIAERREPSSRTAANTKSNCSIHAPNADKHTRQTDKLTDASHNRLSVHSFPTPDSERRVPPLRGHVTSNQGSLKPKCSPLRRQASQFLGQYSIPAKRAAEDAVPGLANQLRPLPG
ncbi:unnamed protein product [Ixodes pacificus]